LRQLLLSGAHDWAPLAEVMLHFASRAEHVATVVEPALARGADVVSDRFADSTMVYQGYGLGADRAAIATLIGLIGVTPDVTLVLDVSVKTTMQRLAARGDVADRYERLGEGFFARIREGFLAVARDHPQRCVVLSGEAAPDDVAAEIDRVLGL
jgi:dTMP kinase